MAAQPFFGIKHLAAVLADVSAPWLCPVCGTSILLVTVGRQSRREEWKNGTPFLTTVFAFCFFVFNPLTTLLKGGDIHILHGLKHPPQDKGIQLIHQGQHRKPQGTPPGAAPGRASQLTIHRPCSLPSAAGEAYRCFHPGDENAYEPTQPR